MDVIPFPLIDTRGPALERGIQYGQQAAERIDRTVAIYQPAFEKAGLGWAEVRDAAHRFIDRLASYDGELLEELRGIAQGSRRPVEDLVAINARTELLYGLRPETTAQTMLDDGCTAAAALPSTTKSAHMLHAQNWDWRDDCYEAVIVLRTELPSGMRMLTMAEAGMLARCGLNSAGIAITGNFLKCELDDGRDGVPVPCVRRRVLSARSFREAISEILHAPRSFSNNVMISHADGEVIDLETTPGPVFWVQAEDGILVHANHFLSPASFAQVQERGLAVTPDSLYRQRRVREKLDANRGALTLRHFSDALADRFGLPFAVCREATLSPGGDRVSTVATVLMDVTARRMWIAPVPYRSRVFFEYDLESSEVKLSEAVDR